MYAAAPLLTVIHPAAAALVDFVEQVNANQAGGLKREHTMIQTTNPEVKDHIMHRLARIEGQLRGVQKMIEANRNCKDIIQQLIAIRASIQSASLSFMQDVADDCLLNLDQDKDPVTQKDVLKDLIQLMGKVSS